MAASTSSTSSSSSAGTLSNGRYWGLATGLDVDSIVSGLTTDYQTKIDKANQQKQILQWKTDAYTDIVNKIKAFESSYLDLTNPDNCMLSSNTYNHFTTSVDNDVVSVTANADAVPGTTSIQVYQSATTGSVKGSSYGSAITGKIGIMDPTSLKNSLTGKNFTITADGVSKVISFSGSEDFSDLQTTLNAKLSSAFGVDASGNCKVAATVDASGNISFDANISKGYSSQVTLTSGILPADIAAGATSALSVFGISEYGASNRLGSSMTIADIFGTGVTSLGATDGLFSVNINGKSVTLSTSDTLANVYKKIASSGANVTMSYDKISGSFSINGSSSGSSGNITLGTDSSSTAFFNKLLGDPAGRQVTKGQDAVFSLDGGLTKMTRSSNNFTVNGISYSITKPVSSTTTANVTLTADPTQTQSSIKKFISAYNDLLDAINTQVGTAPDTTEKYAPLTDAQKEKMSDDEISAWNTKAKQGLLLNDSTLSGVVSNLRSMMYKSVTTSDGKSISLYNMGITTSFGSDGKLSVTDANKLTKYLQDNPDAVTELFTKQSSILYSTGATTSKARIEQEGLGARIKDVLDDAINTAGSTKGSLMVMIGSAADSDTYHTSLYKQIVDINTQITTLKTQMATKKDQLYSKFTQLEVYMQKMNAQTSAITSFQGS